MSDRLITLAGRSGLCARVDAADYEWLSAMSWHRSCAQKPYASTSRDGRSVSMQRLIMGEPEGLFVDHINGDTLDNRRGNLRSCTRAQNSQNRGRTSVSSTGFKGVYPYQPGRWKVIIGVNGRHLYLGLHDDLIEAAKAYDAAALKHHGEFAHLNFPANDLAERKRAA